jgi:prevent-host-death family protein
MQIAVSDLQANAGRYIDLARTNEIIITRSGEPVVKIVPIDYQPWFERKIPEKVTSISELFGTLPANITLDDIKTRRLTN